MATAVRQAVKGGLFVVLNRHDFVTVEALEGHKRGEPSKLGCDPGQLHRAPAIRAISRPLWLIFRWHR